MSLRAKLPFMPFYGVDFYEDEAVSLMEAAEEAVCLRLLWRQWREGSLPADPIGLAGLARAGTVSPAVLGYFPVSPGDGRRRNQWLEEIREKHLLKGEKLSQAGKRGRAKQLSDPKVRPARGEARARPAASAGQAGAWPGQPEPEPESEEKAVSVDSSNQPASRSDDPSDGRIMRAIREHLYLPDGKAPPDWDEAREFTLMHQLRKSGKSGSEILAVVEGLGILLREESVDWLRGKATLRAVFNSHDGALVMWGRAEDAYYRHGENGRKPRPSEDVRRGFQAAAAVARRRAAPVVMSSILEGMQ